MTNAEIEQKIIALREQFCYEHIHFIKALNHSLNDCRLWHQRSKSTKMEIIALRNELSNRKKITNIKIMPTKKSNSGIKKIHVIIEQTKDGYWGYAKNAEKINGVGKTIQECKQSVINCIEIVKTFDEKNIPNIVKGKYELIYAFDTEETIN